jgi:superfamily II DNA or RNA helicase
MLRIVAPVTGGGGAAHGAADGGRRHKCAIDMERKLQRDARVEDRRDEACQLLAKMHNLGPSRELLPWARGGGRKAKGRASSSASPDASDESSTGPDGPARRVKPCVREHKAPGAHTTPEAQDLDGTPPSAALAESAAHEVDEMEDEEGYRPEDEGEGEEMVVEEEKMEKVEDNEDAAVEGKGEGEGGAEDGGEDDPMHGKPEPTEPRMVGALHSGIVKLFAARVSVLRECCPEDDQRHSEFADRFPFMPTPDQITAFAKVADDMIGKPLPMDRLIYGDTSCGKTEVAMRAIHRACCAGRQVVVLAPTTVLARHWKRELDTRMPTEWTIALFSSQEKRSENDHEKQLAQIAAGNVHIIVGTHAVLSAEFKYAQLGLLVVDEEHKFGVHDKERLAMTRASLDVLTLTATPLPRTLHMCRVGIRDVSKLITPPEGRKKTKTYVEEENWERIKTYIEFELDRGGQVLLVVPRIEMVAGTIHKLTNVLAGRPVRIAEAHSDLEERNSTIDEFSRGEIDVLVATTLLENGVDIPKLNTLIVLDMHRFGAASLHQLRGRVGRRNTEARAYLLHPPLATLADKTTSRLAALDEILRLGSGWSLAEDDMERRGAGNLLGTEQKGKGGWEGVEADEFGRIVEEAMRAIEEMVKEGFVDEEGDDDDDEESDDEESDDDDDDGRKEEEEKRVVLTEEEKTAAEAEWIAKKTSNRNFRCITMPKVALLLGMAQTSTPRTAGGDDPRRVEASLTAAEIWAVDPWQHVAKAELASYKKFLQQLVARTGKRKPGHMAAVFYTGEKDASGPSADDETTKKLTSADIETLKKIAEHLLCNGRLKMHACSAVVYPRRRWTRERCEQLLRALEEIRRSKKMTSAEKNAAAQQAVLDATEWAFFRPHTDGHQRIRERVTVAAAVRKAASLATTVRADAGRSADKAFIDAADKLQTVLAQLGDEHGFAPPAAPGLRFGTRGRARFTGYLAWPRGVEDKGGWQSALFGTEAQAHDTAHWRGPPAGGRCIPTEGLGPVVRDPEHEGELSWTGGAGSEEYVVDELCALSFVCWLWPAAMGEELASQPPYPNYVGPSLVVAAGRWAFAEDALGGLLTTLGAVPFEHNEPDATCVMADTLALWRRAKAEGGKPPKAPVPWEGKAVEYAPDASTLALPPIWAGGVGAVRRAPSSASARLLARPGGGNAPRGEGWGGGLVGSRVWRGGDEAAKAAEAKATADEIRAAAAELGLELVPSSKSETGFKNVIMKGGRYLTQIYEDGRNRDLGRFSTPEEAAFRYAEHIGAERAAEEAAEARGRGKTTAADKAKATADEIRAAAAELGLELVPSSKSETGFKNVTMQGGRYMTKISENGRERFLGRFSTPEEAAFRYAEHIGAERAAKEAAEARGEGKTTAAEEAKAAAAKLGLELVPSSKSETGFKNVVMNRGKYVTQISENGRNRILGRFSTPEEAAFRYAEHIGAERAAEEAAEAAVATAKHRVNPAPPTKNVETQLTNTKRQVETKNGRKVIKPRGWEG